MPNLHIDIPEELHTRLKLEAIEEETTLKDLIVTHLSRHL